MCSLKFLRSGLWKFFSAKNNPRIWQWQMEVRNFTRETVLDYCEGSVEHEALRKELRGLRSRLTHIPIRIGELFLGSSNVQFQVMPHNARCPVAQLSTGNKSILYQCKRNGEEPRKEWNETTIKERSEVCNRCADIVASELRHTINASMMLGASKTLRQAEEDTCRTINNLRKYGEILENVDECGTEGDDDYNGYIMKATDGYVAAMTPYNWLAQTINSVICPVMNGKGVIWMPSQYNMLASYKLFLAFIKAGIPPGVISFVPMNRSYFMYKVREMPYIAGINYAGRYRGYETVAAAISRYMDPPNSFVNSIGPYENRNFHFVHESADVDLVARETLLAAFDYNGQRGNSCDNLFVPQSLWRDLQDALVEGAKKLNVGDVCEADVQITAVINRMAFERIVDYIKYAQRSDQCKILAGGNYNKSFGYFVEPTIVVCKTPFDKFMTRDLESPLLSVYVYEAEEFDEIQNYLASGTTYTLAGSVFAESEEKAREIATPLQTAAANIFINRSCTGLMDGLNDELPDLNRDLIAGKTNLLKHW